MPNRVFFAILAAVIVAAGLTVWLATRFAGGAPGWPILLPVLLVALLLRVALSRRTGK